MKEFKKWLKENDWRMYLYSEEIAAKEGYKAALEWALSTRGKDKYGQITNNIQATIIKEELEE